MNQKIIATWFFRFGCFLQNQILPQLLRKFRQHNLIQPYVETVVISCCRRAILLNPSLAEAHYKLGQLFQNQNKWQEAATAFEQATKSGCLKLVDAYCNLGQVFLKLKRHEESIAALSQAIELEPDNNYYYVVLGDVLTKKGELAEAIKNYQIASQKQISKTHPHVLLKLAKTQRLSAPNFLIIGQLKCGTSSLYSYLTQHPQILPAIKKEIKFWYVKHHFNKGLDWYLSHFPVISSELNLITGEASPFYINSESTAQHVFQMLPNLKLIVLLRNPVDQVISHYYMRVRLHIENKSLKEAILLDIENSITTSNSDLCHSHNNRYLKRGRYIEVISQWMELFPKEQFLIVKSEDFFATPATIVDQIFQFLRVESYQLPEYPKVHEGNYPPIPKSIRQILSDYFQPFNQRLEEYLDRKFNWNC